MLDETVWDCRWALKSFSSYFPMKTPTIFFYCISWEKSINTNSTISPQTSLNLCNSTNLVAHIINTLPELFQKVILQNTLWVLKQYGLNRTSQDASGRSEPLASQKTTMVFWVQTNTGNIFFLILPEGKLAINLFLSFLYNASKSHLPFEQLTEVHPFQTTSLSVCIHTTGG